MNGPEHYRKAEELLAAVADAPNRAIAENPSVSAGVFASVIANMLAEAQVHATLALAAAQVAAAPSADRAWEVAL